MSAALPAAGPALLSHGYGSDEDHIDGVPLDATPGNHANLQPRSMSLVNNNGGNSDDDDVDVVTLTKPQEVAVTPTTEATVIPTYTRILNKSNGRFKLINTSYNET